MIIFIVSCGVRLFFSCVSVPPTVDGADTITDATVIINTVLELECHATGTPPPTIT